MADRLVTMVPCSFPSGDSVCVFVRACVRVCARGMSVQASA